MKTQRVVITGLSCITPIGVNIEQTYANCLAGKHAVRNIAKEKEDFKIYKC